MAVIARDDITIVRVDDGETGEGVSANVKQYYLSTSETTQAGGSWSEDVPEWSSGHYIWSRIKTTWTTGEVTTSSPVLEKALNGANSTANTALVSASGKGTVYYQASAPTSGMTTQDLWFDTDDGNTMCRYDGSEWVRVPLGTNSLEDKAITAKKIDVDNLSAISADLGSITAGDINGVSITGSTFQSTDGSFKVDSTGNITGAAIKGSTFETTSRNFVINSGGDIVSRNGTQQLKISDAYVYITNSAYPNSYIRIQYQTRSPLIEVQDADGNHSFMEAGGFSTHAEDGSHSFMDARGFFAHRVSSDNGPSFVYRKSNDSNPAYLPVSCIGSTTATPNGTSMQLTTTSALTNIYGMPDNGRLIVLAMTAAGTSIHLQGVQCLSQKYYALFESKVTTKVTIKWIALSY